MCNILALQPGVVPEIDKFRNCVYNNWHSYGVVTKIEGKLDIRRVVPKSGEVDPQEVFDLLDKDVEFERFVHLRHNTAGATDLRNCHPFEVFFDEKKGRHIVFMHNGTFHEHKSRKIVDNKTVDDDDGPSDSLNYATNLLQPLLAKLGGDITDPLSRTILTKFWGPMNRGVLIASDQEPFYLGEWKKISFGGHECPSANLDYFDEVKRGPEKERREKAKAALKNSSKSEGMFRPFNSGVNVTPLKDIDLLTKPGVGRLSEGLAGILQDWEVYDRPGMTSLGYATQAELEDLYNHKNDCLLTMDLVFTDHAMMYKELIEAEEKLTKQEKIIEKLVLEAKNKEKAA